VLIQQPDAMYGFDGVTVCQALADKLNIPLMFPGQVSAQATCVAAQTGNAVDPSMN
jgi:hypothetical protein